MDRVLATEPGWKHVAGFAATGCVAGGRPFIRAVALAQSEGALVQVGHALRRLIGRLLKPPSVGSVRFGDLRRLAPISRGFGYDRGGPVDRVYIEQFLTLHARDVCGRTLEIGDDEYTRRFGGDRVAVRDVLHVAEGNPQATFVGDLTDAPNVPSNTFDCVVITQTLHLIYDIPAAIRTLHRILRPGGVCLATVPGISQVDAGAWRDTWFWAVTPTAATRLFREVFPPDGVSVEAHGNVLTSCAFLYGLSAAELTAAELAHRDPSYPMLVTIRAVKAGG